MESTSEARAKERISHEISQQTEEKLHQVFDSLDANHNGRLEVPELKEAMKRLGLPARSNDYMIDLLRQYDRNGDGSVDWEEFRQYVVHKERLVQRTFRKLDEDGNGRVSPEELSKALRALWMSVSPDDSARMIQLLDADHDGQMSLDELRSFVYLLPEAQVTPDNIMYALVDSADWMEGVELRLGMQPPKQPFHRLLAGGLAGMASRAAVAPFERMRTMFMADRSQTTMQACAHSIYKEGGVAGMFRGNCATLLKVVPQTAVQFAVYDTIVEAMLASMAKIELAPGADKHQLSKWQHLTAGCAAGAAGTLVTYPFETLRCHMAVGGQSYRQCLAEIIQKHGHVGLYKGLTSGLMSSAISNGLGFASYESGLSAYRAANGGLSPTPAQRGVIAGCAATVVMAAIQPLEVIMRRMQVHPGDGTSVLMRLSDCLRNGNQVQGREGFPVKYTSVADCAYRIVRDEGIASFWRGSMCSFMKVAPSIAAVRFVYEALIQTWGVGGLRKYRGHPSDLPPAMN